MLDSVQLVRLYDESFPATKLDLPASANLRRLAKLLHGDAAMTDQRWRAYALATARTECGQDFAIRTERGPREYFLKYEPGTKLGVRLGNLHPGDGYRFRGRGFVQITGRANYDKFAPLVGYDLVANPDGALAEDVAYQILSLGMVRGLFTGKKLAHYIDGSTCDYTAARRIINGQDKAEAIAADAIKFHQILGQCEIHPAGGAK